MIIEGMIIAGYGMLAEQGYCFYPARNTSVRPGFWKEKLRVAKDAGYPGQEHPGQRLLPGHCRPSQRGALHLRRGHGTAERV